ncbi:MAG: L-serine ammonia-lyase, iron-sulfur-dependent, subunit alpha [Bacteroidales bacterium]|nr:L-serine ammonia-lyase, iron-sulfur-dependent, subunit alpha [Bacteroidales bacterium]
MTQETRKQLLNLIQQEVVLATGCTEPGAVALCVAKSRELLGAIPEKVELLLSKNVFKNAMGVGIPGTGMIGLPIAVAMAIVAGKSERGLEILTIPQSEVDEAKSWLSQNASRISIGVKEVCDKLYIECTCTKGNDKATAIISGRHTSFVHLEKNGKIELSQETGSTTASQGSSPEEIKLSARMVYDFATTAPIEELEFIRETVKYNSAAANEGLKGYGLNTGKILMENAHGDIVHTVVARTVAASDARMDGCQLSVYSNSGSGNQGICCTLPVYEYGSAKGCSEEQITRALILNHLMSIYVKRGIGRLSALCGIVNASIGVTSGLVYLQGGSFDEICYAIKNMINTLAGMVCDGAKPSCALKMSAGLYSAFVNAELARHGKVVDATDGISERDIDFSIRNLGHLGHDGMDQTDDVVLDIMTHKAL